MAKTLTLRLAAGAFGALLIAAPARADDADWSRAKRVGEVTRDYRFVPNHLTFQHGVAYRLHLANRGKEVHEFHSPEFFAAIDVRNPALLDSDRTEIVLQPGDVKDFYFVARRPGHYPLICPDHDWAGMTGEITIK